MLKISLNRSAFFLYCADHRASLKAANPGYTVGDVAKALGKQWQEVDEKLKKSYQEKGEIEKQKYNKVSFLLIIKYVRLNLKKVQITV